jgi:DNA polymerase-3 subunit gamma/tau
MPVSGRFKVYIIDEVHMLSKHAFNSMLKTLEEPPEHVKFILATTDPQRLPVTVLSRCLQFNLKPLSPALIAGHLRNVLQSEGIAFEDQALAQLGKAAAGSLRDSLSLLDQAIAHGAGRITAAQVAEMLGSLGGDLIWPLLEKVVEGDGKGTVAEAERIAGRSVSFDAALEELAAILHRIALAQAGAGPAEDEEDAARVSAMASRLDAGRIQVMYQIALLGRRDLSLAPDEFAGFTMALLRMLSFAQPGAEAKALPRSTPISRPETRQPAPAISVAPAAVAPPVAAAAPAIAPTKIDFDGNWPALVERLNLTGMAGMVARYGELVSYQNGHLELAVPESHRMYAEKGYQDKLKAELAAHFGTGLRLTVKVGATGGNSVAAARTKEMDERQASAAEAIEDDPFVRELVRDLGAEVVTSSIRPAENAPGGQPKEKR